MNRTFVIVLCIAMAAVAGVVVWGYCSLAKTFKGGM